MNLLQLTKIRWAGYFSNLISFSAAVILIVQMPAYYDNYKVDREKVIDKVIFSTDIFTAFGACFFSFTNHFAIVTILKTLKK